MDSGLLYMGKVKNIPALGHHVSTSSKNTSNIELPWSDFSKLLSSKYSTNNSVTPQDLFVGSFENCHLGNWDGSTHHDIHHFPLK
ncbi:unnamed protein product [Cunninghamella echinulata]